MDRWFDNKAQLPRRSAQCKVKGSSASTFRYAIRLILKRKFRNTAIGTTKARYRESRKYGGVGERVEAPVFRFSGLCASSCAISICRVPGLLFAHQAETGPAIRQLDVAPLRLFKQPVLDFHSAPVNWQLRWTLWRTCAAPFNSAPRDSPKARGAFENSVRDPFCFRDAARPSAANHERPAGRVGVRSARRHGVLPTSWNAWGMHGPAPWESRNIERVERTGKAMAHRLR